MVILLNRVPLEGAGLHLTYFFPSIRDTAGCNMNDRNIATLKKMLILKSTSHSQIWDWAQAAVPQTHFFC